MTIAVDLGRKATKQKQTHHHLLNMIIPIPFYWEKFSITTGWIVVNFWDMVDMDLKLYKRVSKCLALSLAHGLPQKAEILLRRFFQHYFWT